MTRLPVALVLVLAAACSDGGSNPSDLAIDQAKNADDRFLGHWPKCTFSRRLTFTTPAGTPDRAMVDISGSLDVTDNGNGTIKLTPTATGITNCILDFTRTGPSAS